MPKRSCAVLSILLISLVLGAPLHAQRLPGPVEYPSGVVLALWERWVTPILARWAADETDSRGGLDPLGGDAEGPDGRGAADPNGASEDTDSRGGLDPLG